jgi:hypothetical protein
MRETVTVQEPSQCDPMNGKGFRWLHDFRPLVIGAFSNGRREFYDQEEREGRPILVRYVWSGVTTKSPHFEQSFSADWGKTWETNWITDQTKETP